MQRKMVVIHQQDAKDCGPCALKSIVEYYGGYVSLEKIREHAYTNNEGTTVYHLVNAAKKYGFDAIAKKYLDKKIDNIILPAIVHIHYENGLTHYMCLYKITKDKVILMDPAKGKIAMLADDFEKIFTGVVIELSLKNEIICLEKESSIYKLFINIVTLNKKLCLNLFGCSIILTIFTIVSGLYFKVGYELIQNNSFINSLNVIIYLFLIVILLKLLFGYLKNYYENHINKNIDVNIFSGFIVHIFHLPLKVINQRAIGEIISRINEISNIKELFSKIFVSCFLDLVLSIGSFIMLLYINKSLAFLICLVMFLYIIISLLSSPYLYQRIKKNIDYETEFNSHLIENLEMINSVKNLNRTENILEQIEKKLSVLLFDNYSFTNIVNSLSFFKNLVYELGIFIINTYGFYQIYQGKFSLVNLVIFNALLVYFTEPIKNIESLIPKFNFLRASFRKICDFIDLKEEKLDTEEPFINGDIHFQSISFSYNDYYKIIDNFNLTIKKGEKIAIRGHSGCGKSTICKLLQKMYEPLSGNITIGDKNLKDYNVSTIRKNIIYVGQKENLFSDTIKNNIVFYNNEIKNFEKVCRVCLVDKIVDTKQFRYDFGIDTNYANISGGEKQRIVLARALLSGGDVLILDEALSELDMKTERKIIENIKRNFPYKTIIYVTHKNHDKLFDRVITMEKKYE